MLADERAAVGELAGHGFAEAVGRIRETHEAIAGRVFAHVGAGPTRIAHDRIARLAYDATGLGGRALLALGGRLSAQLAGPQAPSLEARPVGRIVRGALSGMHGDLLEARGNPLAVRMAVRSRGRDVPATPQELAAAFPAATPRLAVFLHGLCETEDAWWLGAGRSRPYGPRLRSELGYTPVYVRYNSGLHISENGRRLSALLSDVVLAWPTEVLEIALIGHSMGGLIARSACHYGASEPWTRPVRHVVSLGSPHTGAPLEQGAHALSWALSRLPETRPLSSVINARSAGIKDLGRGWLTEECWSDSDPQTLLRAAAREIPFLPGAHHYFVAASLAGKHDHPLGRHLGDLLVLHASAWGGARRGERLRFPVEHYRHVGGATHFDLLNHPVVAEQLLRWLAPRPALCAGTA
jgi:hypothetical protein